ncbi:hypothetical protein [Roseovarius indicus]|uniref:NADH dehydrogenase n=1 Tax=Roseovarius indicus TaxID=540747 RepID=A0A0T5P908_9RHOB|nr:hypothetical protein [Roseovarius indicus]KRS17374.1 NADH dehydrogenase [Roseovarius indicus]OAO06528.1 NADH dehydrogenase [Roseovarius indicus]QEW26551.1 hypothetical protein RIdsm_02351 [Roseovarius indicus]SFD63593.1 hypothetical protein SAMN04488031_101991 [Roseovarius indicus]
MRFAKCLALAGLPLGLAACMTTPEGVNEQMIADYTAAVATIGCEMKYDSDYLPVELQAGITRQQALDITSYMLANDKAVNLPDGGVKLTTGACA